MEYRIEKDTLGEVKVEKNKLWGPQTQRSIENFKIGGHQFPREFIRAYGIIKKAAATVNNANGKLDKNIQIKNIEKFKTLKNSFIYHAGTKLEGGKYLSIGGRVLNITSLGDSLFEVRKKIFRIIRSINWKSGFFRKDIGWRVIKKK